MTWSADIDSTLQLFFVKIATKPLAAMEFSRNQVVEGEIPFTGTEFTYTVSESLRHGISIVEIGAGS